MLGQDYNPFYKVIRKILDIILHVSFRLHVEGLENIPENGPLLVCCNHISLWDPPLVGVLFKDRRVNFMAKEELFRLPILGFALKKLGAFSVKRDTADRNAIRKALAILHSGGIVGVFPEGTRSKTGRVQAPLNGPALIALKSGAPVLPVAIKGPYKLFKPVVAKVGNTISFEKLPANTKRRLQLDAVSKIIMQEISQLVGK